MKTYRLTAAIVMLVLVLGACNMPSSSQPTQAVTNPNAVFTAAAETVVAQLTQNALLVPTNPPAATVAAPTDTQAPAITDTPLAPAITATSKPITIPTQSCDAAQFITDVTIPDDTIFSGSATFVKTWRLKNIGSCTWSSSYSLVFDSGDAMGGPTNQSISGSVAPGASIDVSVNLQAPASDGTYRGYWGITNPSGQRVSVAGGSNGRSFYVEIKVGSGGEASGKFAVTSVNFNVARSGACSSMQYTVTADVSANKAGDVTYTWIRSDGATGSSMSGSLSFDKASTQSITFTWTFGGGGQWVELYIDKPNHQQFGRANLNCP